MLEIKQKIGENALKIRVNLFWGNEFWKSFGYKLYKYIN